MKKKLSALALALAFLAACLGAKSMRVVYTIEPAAPLKNYTLYLVVNDGRAISDLVGPAARDRGLFQELRADRFDLRIIIPDGSEVIMTNLPTSAAVKEAVRRRLAGRGLVVTAQRPAAQLTAEVDIRAFNLDVADGDLVATVSLSVKIYRDPSAVTSSDTHVVANRLKLPGGLGGDKVLSDALTRAVNDLDFSAVNRY